MEYIKPINKIDINEYEYIVSIGNKCPTAMILRELKLYKESFPFDYVPTTPKLILKYLKDNTEYFPKKNEIRTKDELWFGHFDINEKYDETIEKFKRRFDRLYEILNNKKKILFVYTSEADVYNEMGNRYNYNYGDLCKLKDFIEKTYNYDNFTILAIHNNKTCKDTKNILNYTIKVPDIYLSDDMSTHTNDVTKKYRDVLKCLIKDIFDK